MHWHAFILHEFERIFVSALVISFARWNFFYNPRLFSMNVIITIFPLCLNDFRFFFNDPMNRSKSEITIMAYFRLYEILLLSFQFNDSFVFHRSGDLQQSGLSDSHEGKVKLKAAYDAGWQKKGSGRAYNSLTGKFSTL